MTVCHGQFALDDANNWTAISNNPEYRIQNYDGCQLLLIAGFDLAYYHELELEFFEVTYIDLPTIVETPTI